MRYHHQIFVEARAVVRIQKCRTVPSFWDAKLQDVNGQSCGVSFVFPKIVPAEIGEDQNGSEHGEYRDSPMITQGNESIRKFHGLGSWRTGDALHQGLTIRNYVTMANLEFHPLIDQIGE